MFHLKNNTIQNELERKNHSLEFCLAFKKKDYFKDYEIYKLNGIEHFILRNDRNQIFTFNGVSITSSFKSFLKSIGEDTSNIEDRSKFSDHISKLERKDLLKINFNLVEKFSSLYEDSHKLVLNKEIKDNQNEDFTIEIYENVDTRLNFMAINDLLIIKKHGDKVGNMTIQYVNDDIMNLIQQNKNLYPFFKKKGYNFFNNIDDMNSFYLEGGDSLSKREKDEAKDAISLFHFFHNKAFPEYSCVDYDKDYSGRGLGRQMYFYMSQHLNKKNVILRASSLLNDKSTALWNSIKRDFKPYVSEFKDGEDVYPTLSIPQGLIYQNTFNTKPRKKLNI